MSNNRMTPQDLARASEMVVKLGVTAQRLAKARRVVGRMNKLEAEYEALFLGRRPHGFEQMTFRLGDDCRYTPDFWVIADDDVLELHEVKGHWMDGAKEKIRIASEMFPHFRWKAFRRVKKAWMVESFGQEDAERKKAQAVKEDEV